MHDFSNGYCQNTGSRGKKNCSTFIKTGTWDLSNTKILFKKNYLDLVLKVEW